jgi:hypothetical protein
MGPSRPLTGIALLYKEELPDKWNEYIIVPVHKKGDKTDFATVIYHCYQLHPKFYPFSSSQSGRGYSFVVNAYLKF